MASDTPKDSELSKDGAPQPLHLGKAETLRPGKDVLLLAYGSMVYPAYEAAKLLEKDGVDAAVINARFAKPLDERAILDAARDAKLVLTLEDVGVDAHARNQS